MAVKKRDESTHKDEMEALLYQYQILGAQAETLQKQTVLLEEGLREVNETRKTLEELKGLKKGDEIMVPLGSNTFVRGSLGDLSKILVNVGANALREKNVESALETLDKRKDDIEKTQKKVGEEFARVQMAMAALEPELQKVLKG